MIQIAIVEDEEIYVKQLTEYIRKYQTERGKSIKVTIFGDGEDITENYSGSFDIILMDIQMPVMNGFQFLKHVENNSDYNRIPILVTTVLDGEEDEKECLKLGVSDFIVKPYSPLLVKMRVENIIHMTESEDMISELEMDALTG